MPVIDPSQFAPGLPPPDPSLYPMMGTPPPDTSQPQQPQVSLAPQQPLDPGSDHELNAAAVHHSRLANALNSVADILGGNKTLKLMKNPDGSVSLTQEDATPGEKWGRIAQAALSGAAKGFAVGQGPGGPQRAAAAGIQSGLAQPKEQQDQTLALADKWNDQNRQQQLFKANMAKLNQNLIQGAWQMQRDKINAAQHDEDRDETIRSTMQNLNAKKFHVGPDMMEDLANYYNSTPELRQAHHDGRTAFYRTTDPKTGQVNGGDIYIVPEDEMNKLNDQDYVRRRLVLNPDDPTAKPKIETLGTVSKGSTSKKNVLAMMQADDDAWNKTIDQWEQRNGVIAQARATEAGAKATEAAARATAASNSAANAGTWHEVVYNGQPALMNDKTREIKMVPGLQTVGQRSANDRADASTRQYVDKNYVSKARDVEQAYSLFNDAYQEHLSGTKTGAPGMLALSQHLGNTFGSIKGGRINKDLIAEHLGARGITDTMEVAVNKLVNGDPLSDDQWKAFGQLMKNSRTESWRKASDAANSNEVDPNNFLPSDLKNGDVARGYNRAPAGPAPGPGGAPAGPSQVTVPPIPPGHTPQVNYVKGSDNKFYWIEPQNLDAAKKADPNLQVIPR